MSGTFLVAQPLRRPGVCTGAMSLLEATGVLGCAGSGVLGRAAGSDAGVGTDLLGPVCTDASSSNAYGRQTCCTSCTGSGVCDRRGAGSVVLGRDEGIGTDLLVEGPVCTGAKG